MALVAAEKKFEGSGVAPLMTSLFWSPPPMLENRPRIPRLQLASPDSGDALLRKTCISFGGASPSQDNFLFFAGVCRVRVRFFAIFKGVREEKIYTRSGYRISMGISGSRQLSARMSTLATVKIYTGWMFRKSRQREGQYRYRKKRCHEEQDGEMSRLFKE